MSDRTSISAKVIADSIYNRSRLTTFEVVFPRLLLPEFNTHRDFSRNSASSRAIPVWKKIVEVINNPFVPLSLGKNKPGMQAAEKISDDDLEAAKHDWIVGSQIAAIQAFMLAGGEEQLLKDYGNSPAVLQMCEAMRTYMNTFRGVVSEMRPLSVGVHKQHANRVLEPYAWHTVIITSSYWRNFYALRASEDAQPEIDDLAIAMIRAHKESVPQELKDGEWHLPFISPEDREELNGEWEPLARVSSARCARVSSLTHDGKREIEKDLEMADKKLQEPGHMSPFEHPAKAELVAERFLDTYRSNFGPGWIQYRKMLPGERDFSRLIPREKLVAGCGGDEELADFVYGLPA